MMNIDITIAGVSPLLVHAFTDEDQLAASSGSRKSSAAGSRGTPYEQAEKHLHISEQDGKPIMPQPNLQSCIIAAGAFFKNGRSKITTMRSSLIPACVFWNDTEFPLISKGGWSVDTRAVRIPATGGRIQRHRPCFFDWSVKFDVDLDTSEMHQSLFREIVDAAGQKVGLCDFRPATKGPFGRFVVTNWVESEAQAPQPIAAE